MKCETDIKNTACICNRFDLNRQEITEHETYKYHLGKTFFNWNTAMVMNKTILLFVRLFTFHICDVISEKEPYCGTNSSILGQLFSH